MTNTIPRSVQKKLSPNELAIMTALWDVGEGTGKEVLSRVSPPLAQTTLLTYLTRLETKGYVRRQQSDHGYIYMAAVPRISVASRLLDQALTQFDGRLSSLVSHFVQTRKLNDDERKRLRDVIDQLDQEV
jgi:BlaI family transcriptional regulator, penicillinase repressor